MQLFVDVKVSISLVHSHHQPQRLECNTSKAFEMCRRIRTILFANEMRDFIPQIECAPLNTIVFVRIDRVADASNLDESSTIWTRHRLRNVI